MKVLLLSLIFLMGCSLVRINEVRPEPRHRSEMLTVSMFDCSLSSDCKNTAEVRVARSHISYYSEYDGQCFLIIQADQKAHRLDMTCKEFDDYLNQ